MDTRDIETLERLVGVLRIEQRKNATAHGLQMVHHDILDYLGRCNRYSDTMQSVCEFLGLTKGTVSQSLKLLEENGYIKKTPDVNDGRVQHLHLTDAGREYVWGCDTLTRELFENITVSHAYGRVFGTILNDVLWQLQMQRNRKGFMQCRTCRHNRLQAEGRFFCGLTSEELSAEDTQKICREHEFAG